LSESFLSSSNLPQNTSELVSFTPHLAIENWHCQTTNEAMVFVHGYNIPLEWAVKKFGQMLAGAGYPAFIKPFLFSWPTGKLFFYTKV
jgi:esterase/lipase superfamily enzyme